jgi:hypothetical protein
VVVEGRRLHERPLRTSPVPDGGEQALDVEQLAQRVPQVRVREERLLLVEAEVPPRVGLVGVELDLLVVLQHREVARQHAHQRLEALVEEHFAW